MQDLIDENPDIAKAVKDLPGYTVPNTPLTLFTHSYVDWDLKCQNSDEAHMDKIAEKNNPINTLANIQLLYMII